MCRTRTCHFAHTYPAHAAHRRRGPLCIDCAYGICNPAHTSRATTSWHTDAVPSRSRSTCTCPLTGTAITDPTLDAPSHRASRSAVNEAPPPAANEARSLPPSHRGRHRVLSAPSFTNPCAPDGELRSWHPRLGFVHSSPDRGCLRARLHDRSHLRYCDPDGLRSRLTFARAIPASGPLCALYLHVTPPTPSQLQPLMPHVSPTIHSRPGRRGTHTLTIHSRREGGVLRPSRSAQRCVVLVPVCSVAPLSPRWAVAARPLARKLRLCLGTRRTRAEILRARRASATEEAHLALVRRLLGRGEPVGRPHA